MTLYDLNIKVKKVNGRKKTRSCLPVDGATSTETSFTPVSPLQVSFLSRMATFHFFSSTFFRCTHRNSSVAAVPKKRREPAGLPRAAFLFNNFFFVAFSKYFFERKNIYIK